LLFYPKVLNPSTSGIPDKHFNSKLAVLTYEAFGGKPEFWTPPQPPSEAFNVISVDQSDMDMISNQFGFSRGQQQAGSPSGALAQLLVEQDNSELSPLISMHARAWEYIGERLLELHRKFSGEKELLVLAGEGGIPDVSYFTGPDIPLGLKVEVQEDSLAPRIRSARVQMMKDLTQQGFFGNIMEDAKTRRKLLEYAGQPAGLMPTDTPELMHRSIAEKENFALIESGGRLYSGLPVQRRPTDDDEIHLEVMLERANQVDSFEWTPETWQVFMAHMQEHQESLQQAQQAQEQQQLDAAKRMREIETQAVIKEDVASIAAKKIGGGGREGAEHEEAERGGKSEAGAGN
jgi:hypothetical protein